VFDVFEAFLNTDNIQVFANAATSYIMCLMKFVKGLGKWNPPLIIHSHCRPFPKLFCREVPGERILGGSPGLLSCQFLRQQRGKSIGGG
jgi:hypothetical protein